jgi:hypothetical protein
MKKTDAWVVVHHEDSEEGRFFFGTNEFQIAEVCVDDDLSDEQQLSEAFRATQNIHGSWSMGENFSDGLPNEDYNEHVIVCQKPKANVGHRSTMVGDRMILKFFDGRTGLHHRKSFKVADFGFDLIDESSSYYRR